MGQAPKYGIDGSIEIENGEWDHDLIFAIVAASLLILFMPGMALLLWLNGLL